MVKLTDEQVEDIVKKLRDCPTEGYAAGRNQGVPVSEFDPRVIANGTLHEIEHADDPCVAFNIAKDHVAEIPDYYKRIKLAENPKFWSLLRWTKKDWLAPAPPAEGEEKES